MMNTKVLEVVTPPSIYQSQVTREEGGPLSAELNSGRGLHDFLGHLAYRVDPAAGLEHLTLLGVDRDGTVHILHSFFSVPVGPYATTRRLLAFSGDLPTEVPPL